LLDLYFLNYFYQLLGLMKEELSRILTEEENLKLNYYQRKP